MVLASGDNDVQRLGRGLLSKLMEEALRIIVEAEAGEFVGTCCHDAVVCSRCAGRTTPLYFVPDHCFIGDIL